MTIDIRELRASDAAAYQALRLTALQEMPSAFSSSYEEECGNDQDTVADRLRSTPSSCVLGAFLDAELVGMLGVLRERPRKLSHKALVWGMFVASPHRKLGIGRKLVVNALARAAAMSGVRQVNLSVSASGNAAKALYESCGFETFGIERGFMMLNGQLLDEIHMVHHLQKPIDR